MNQTRTYTYDAENRIISVSGDVSASYVYDAEGRRARKTVSGNSNDFLYDLGGHAIAVLNGSTGGWQRGEIFAGGMHLATYVAATTFFVHTDWMGSERVRTDPDGYQAQNCKYKDFGSPDGCTGTYTDPTQLSPHNYAGYERDSETGLDHTWFRYYNPRLGRFMTPDPYDGSMDLSDPQSLNRYAYVGGNPTNFFDPLGLKCINKNGKDISSDEGTKERCKAAGGEWFDDEYEIDDSFLNFEWCATHRSACGLGPHIDPNVPSIGVAPTAPKPAPPKTAADYQKANECIVLGALKLGTGMLPLPDDVVDPSDPVGSAVAVATKFADFLASPLGAGTLAMKLNVAGRVGGKFLRKVALPVAIVVSAVSTHEYLEQRAAEGKCGH